MTALVSSVTLRYRAFPIKFRILVLALFVDRIGGTMLFPFYALYITRHFHVGMTEAGLLLGTWALAGLFGSMIGGALADKIGRRSIVIFGLLSSAGGSLLMGLVNDLSAFFVLAALSGLLNSVAGPAHSAMVADMLPEDQRAEGFGMLRIAGNLAWILGPTIGAVLSARSYLPLFVVDAISSTITAIIVYRLIPETRPTPEAGAEPQSLLQTLSGYRVVAQDRLYVAFLVVSVLMGLVYQQMYNTLSVYLRDVHGVPDRGYGFLLSLDALVVVCLQFWIAGKAKKYPPMLMMALGTALYTLGFSMYGFVASYTLFVVAILIITLGEMIIMPVSQALAARFAPPEMRGRYMAFFELTWTLPAMVGPAAAGLILDHYDPNWVWYLAGIIAATAACAFYGLHFLTQQRFRVVAGAAEQA